MANTSGDTTRHLQKLAALILQRRVALGFTSKELAADACGLSHMTYRKIEGTRGVAPQRASDPTYAKVEVAFQIRAGACRAVADGETDSITLEDGTELIEGGSIRDFANSDRLEEEVDRAFDMSAQLTAPHLTLSEAKAMKEEMKRELRERGVLKPE